MQFSAIGNSSSNGSCGAGAGDMPALTDDAELPILLAHAARAVRLAHHGVAKQVLDGTAAQGSKVDFVRELTQKATNGKGSLTSADAAAAAAANAAVAESEMFGPESFFSAARPDRAELARRKDLFATYPGFKAWYRHEDNGEEEKEEEEEEDWPRSLGSVWL